MALTVEQIAKVVQITLKPLEKIEAAVIALTPEQESLIAEDIETWEPVKNSHVKLSGGRDGVDFDNERKRQAVRARILVQLGLLTPPPFFALASATRGR